MSDSRQGFAYRDRLCNFKREKTESSHRMPINDCFLFGHKDDPLQDAENSEDKSESKREKA